MATVLNTTSLPMASKRKQTDALPLPLLLLALIMAAIGAALWKITDISAGLVMALPLVLCAFARPHFFLNLSIALCPFTYSLSGEKTAGTKDAVTTTSAAFGFSDLFLLMVLPGVLFSILTHPGRTKLGRLSVALTAFLTVCIVSFMYNLPEMKDGYVSYFIGFLRSAQIILIIPVFFASLDWEPRQLRGMLQSYLAGATFLGVAGIIAFAMGTRSGLYILGNHKNGTGLALSFGALIAIAALTQKPSAPNEKQKTPSEPLGFSRPWLIFSTAICLLGCLAALSRGAYLATLIGLFYISVVRKRGRIFGTVLVLLSLGLAVLFAALPEKELAYVKDISTTRNSNHTRIDQAQLAIQRFQESPILGDGLRARRDFLPHNLEMLLLSETGVMGILSFGFLLFTQMMIFKQARKTFEGDPLREWVCVAVCACSIAVLIHSQTDPYWRRGPLWLPWAGTGLILAMLRDEMRLRRLALEKTRQQEDQQYRLKRLELNQQRDLARSAGKTLPVSE